MSTSIDPNPAVDPQTGIIYFYNHELRAIQKLVDDRNTTVFSGCGTCSSLRIPARSRFLYFVDQPSNQQSTHLLRLDLNTGQTIILKKFDEKINYAQVFPVPELGKLLFCNRTNNVFFYTLDGEYVSKIDIPQEFGQVASVAWDSKTRELLVGLGSV